ncbi:MAG: heavy metal translocating P-type ATPase [Phycisphaerales bacterium JB041]
MPGTTITTESDAETHDEPRAREFVLWEPKVQLALSVAAGVFLLGEYVVGWIPGLSAAGVLAWASLAIGLIYGVRAAVQALAEHRVDIDVLMVVAAGTAAAVGHAEEGALLLVLFTFAGALEQLAMERTKREINALKAVMPDRAIVLRDGEWRDVRPEELEVGETVRVRPGDRVPVDAEITEGVSSVDQSTLTGESMPRSVGVGDEVFAGTINGEGVLLTQVHKPASESSVQRILTLVTDAREQREPLQRAIDRVGEPYTFSVLAVSAAVFLLWWLALPEIVGGPRSVGDAAYTAITLLIVMSPCALVIATPTATLAAIARGARAGVLFKGGESIDRLSRTRAVCFDKTGTLTVGRPVFCEMIAREPSEAPDLLAVAAALEQDSTHPTAKAIFEAVGPGAGAESGPASVEGVRSIAGQGMVGRWSGFDARVGNLAFISEIIDPSAASWLERTLADARMAGQLGVAVAVRRGEGNDSVGVIVLRDAVRRGADSLVARLHEIGVRPVRMLTGDDEIVARRIAEEVGLDDYRAQLLPGEKVDEVRALQAGAEGGDPVRVAVIGDGVNDAPALAAADVSIAVGSIGSDAALESADIVLLSDDLGRVPWAVRLARATRRTVAVNLAFAGAVIVAMGLVVVIGSLFGLRVPMALGVVAHEGGTVVVVINSLRLLWFAAARR